MNALNRENPGGIAKICIDINSLINRVANDEFDIVCGGRHQVALSMWRKMLFSLKATDCRLIFFAELTLQENQMYEWLKRQNERFDVYRNVYTMIEAQLISPWVVAEDQSELVATCYGLELIAQGYGEFHYAIKNNCDLELAQYAAHENVMAVITNNMDFLIFNGSWRVWMADDFHLTAENRFNGVEFTRWTILNTLSLTQQQLPLFATLLGNNITKHYEQLTNFHCSLSAGWTYDIAKSVAQYVRQFGNDELLDAQIAQITKHIFGADPNVQTVIKNSLQSYNIDFEPSSIDDPLEKRLLSTNMSMYRSYVEHKSSIQGICMPFYDMHNFSFPLILADWMKRKIGILRYHDQDYSFKFLLLTKQSLYEPFYAYHVEPVYPCCKLAFG